MGIAYLKIIEMGQVQVKGFLCRGTRTCSSTARAIYVSVQFGM